MKTTKFIKPEKLVEYYAQEIQEALFENKLYDIEFIGWLGGEGNVDPDYSGYAERIINPLIKFDILDLAFHEKTFPNTKDDVDIEIMTLGDDFIEAMKGAYLMLGQSLFFSKHEREELSTTYGSANLNGAIFQLNIAADRIRDYYVYALTGKSFEKYKKSSKNNEEKNKKGEYAYFFSDVLEINPNDQISSWQQKANSFAIDVQKHRKARNDIAHSIASQNAKLQKAFFINQKNNESKLFPDNLTLFPDDLPANIEWYKLLVELGNLVFLIESKTRKQEP